MKNNKLVKITSLVLFVAIIAMVLVAGTYAKYISTANGSATATVAKWDIKAGVAGEELSITGDNATVAFNLFDTIVDEDGSTEVDVIADGDGKVLKIAPGTSGEFVMSIKNDSEVTAEYALTFEIDDTDLPDGTTLPLEFKVNDGAWASSLDAVAATRIEMGTSDTVTVQWRWAFDNAAGDANDTALGINAPDVEVSTTLTVSQVD